MAKVNVTRNREVYLHWKAGRTIDQISLVAGIPRSTVGYYVKKFKREEREGRPMEVNAGKNAPLNDPFLSLIKTMLLQRIIAMILDGDYEKLHYFLASFKESMEIFRYLKLTPEEQRELGKALKSSLETIQQVQKEARQ